MKKFLRNKKLMATLVTFVLGLTLIAVTLTFSQKSQKPSFVKQFSNDTVGIVSKVVNWPFSIVHHGVERVGDLIDTYQENDHLKQQVDDLAQTKVRNRTLEDENKQLKHNLKLKKTLTDYELVVASVISRSPDNWSDIITIDQGSNSGLKKNMAVMAGEGVIGRVTEVNHTSSKVELITTTDKSASRFAVEGKLSQDNYFHGIVNGFDEKTGNLLLSQVEKGKKIKPGTKIYTSGLGGKSPKGLLIGTVGKTAKDNFGLSDVIQIKPATNLNNFSIVSVIIREVGEE